MYQLDFVCIPSFQHAIIADFGCSLLTSKPSYNGEKVITEFRAMTFISMRHLRRKNVIGNYGISCNDIHFNATFTKKKCDWSKSKRTRNQKEPEPKLHTPLLLVSIPTIPLHFSQQSIHGHKTNPN